MLTARATRSIPECTGEAGERSPVAADEARTAAVAALPEELQPAARRRDTTPFPVQRRVFTETAPIDDFQKKLLRRDLD